MKNAPDWWRKPRRVSVVVDNASWILPTAQALVTALHEGGDDARLCRDYQAVSSGGVAVFLGCTGLAGAAVLARNHRNLVVHESELPAGRGFSPLTWQVLEGRNEIAICLLEAGADADGGDVIYRDRMLFRGDELVDELRETQGRMTIAMCLRYFTEPAPPAGKRQDGTPSHYRRRQPADSRLDVHRPLAEQFDLLRVVDNERYPAFIEHRGCRYRLAITKIGPADAGAGGES
jgi:methionyl-tRNA formyltransferase